MSTGSYKLTMPTMSARPGSAVVDVPAPDVVDNKDQAPDLSFGIEFEYMYAVHYQTEVDGMLDLTPKEAWGAKAVHAVLTKDMHATCSTCSKPVTFKLPLFSRWLGEREPRYDLWSVGCEAKVISPGEVAVLGNKRKEYVTDGVEVRSRILSRRKDLLLPPSPGTSHRHQLTCEQEISAVLDHLRTHFCSFDQNKQDEYLYANLTSSIHVHIGNHDQGFELEDVKKILCFYLACERLIDRMHSPQRIDGFDSTHRPVDLASGQTHSLNWAHNVPLSAGFQYRAYCRRRAADDSVKEFIFLDNQYSYPRSHWDDPDVYAASLAHDLDSWMLLLKGAPLIQDICDNMYYVDTRNSNVNIDNLIKSGFASGKKKMTVEFRQHDGTMEMVRVMPYIDFLTRIVTYCQKNTWTEIDKQMGPNGSLRQAEATVLDMCKVLGCDDRTLAHHSDCFDQKYTKTFRHEECKRARQASNSGNLLAGLATWGIENERTSMDAANRERAINEKLRFAGYGLFHEDLAKKLLGSEHTELELRKITLGFDSGAPANKQDYDKSKYHFSRNYKKPTPGSSLNPSPAVYPTIGSEQLRGRDQNRTLARTPSGSPFALPGAADPDSSRRGSPSSSSISYLQDRLQGLSGPSVSDLAAHIRGYSIPTPDREESPDPVYDALFGP